MPVYNEKPCVGEAVQSVLDQTFENFEFIIINDGSTDGSREVLEQFADRDERIQLVHQENRGMVPSLNRGLDVARGRYIARLDADDLSHPERFKRQVQYLNDNPTVGIVFSWAKQIDENDAGIGTWRSPTDPNFIRWSLLFTNRLCHSTAMVRHDVMEYLGGYREELETAVDYELWTRAVQKTDLEVIPHELVSYRRWENSATARQRKEQIESCCDTAVRFHRSLLSADVDVDAVRFITWMSHENIKSAKKNYPYVETEEVIRYISNVYKNYVNKYNKDESYNKIKKDAINRINYSCSGFDKKLRTKYELMKSYLLGPERVLNIRLIKDIKNRLKK
jgi:glycosyltransferase involved in cell wall biosynthesis